MILGAKKEALLPIDYKYVKENGFKWVICLRMSEKLYILAEGPKPVSQN